MEDKELLEMNIADTIIERPVGFNIGSQQFYLYPPTLGITYHLARLFKSLEADARLISAKPFGYVPKRRRLFAEYCLTIRSTGRKMSLMALRWKHGRRNSLN